MGLTSNIHFIKLKDFSHLSILAKKLITFSLKIRSRACMTSHIKTLTVIDTTIDHLVGNFSVNVRYHFFDRIVLYVTVFVNLNKTSFLEWLLFCLISEEDL